MGILAGIFKGAADRYVQLSDAERKAEEERKKLADARTFATTERIAGQEFQKEMKEAEIELAKETTKETRAYQEGQEKERRAYQEGQEKERRVYQEGQEEKRQELAETKLKETRAYQEGRYKIEKADLEDREKRRRESAEKIKDLDINYYSPITQNLDIGKNGMGIPMPKKRTLEDRMVYLSQITSDPEIYKKIQDSEPNKRAYANELLIVRGLLKDNYIKALKDQGVNVDGGYNIDITHPSIISQGLFRLFQNNPNLKNDMFQMETTIKKQELQQNKIPGSVTTTSSPTNIPVQIPKNKDNIVNNAMNNLKMINPALSDKNAAYAFMKVNGVSYDPNIPPTEGNNSFFHGLLRADPKTKKPLALFSTISQPNNDAPLPSNVQGSLAQMRRYGWIGPKGEVTQENFPLFSKYLSFAANNTKNNLDKTSGLGLVSISGKTFEPVTIGGTGKNQTAQQKEDIKFLAGIRQQEIQINGTLTNITTLEGLVKNFNIGGTFDQFVRALPSKISSAAKTISNLINPDSGEATIENFDFGEGVLRSALNDKSVRFVGGAKDYIQKKLDKLTDEISKNDQQAINTARIEVLQTALSYQLASVLQGGQDARTISDKDVALVSRMFNSALDSPVVLKNRIAQIKKYVLQKALTISLYSGLRGETPIGRLYNARKMEKILDQRRNAFSPYAEQGSGTDGLEEDILRKADAVSMKSGAKVSPNNTFNKKHKVNVLINTYSDPDNRQFNDAINGFVENTVERGLPNVREADNIAGGQSMLLDERIANRIKNYITDELKVGGEKSVEKYLQQGLKVSIDSIRGLKSRVENGIGEKEDRLKEGIIGLLLTGKNAGKIVPMHYYLVQERNDQGEPFITIGASPIKSETQSTTSAMRDQMIRMGEDPFARRLKSIEKLFGKEAVKQALPEEGFQKAGPF